MWLEEHVRVPELSPRRSRAPLDDLSCAPDAVAELALPEPDTGDPELEFELELIAHRPGHQVLGRTKAPVIPAGCFLVVAHLATERRFLEE